MKKELALSFVRHLLTFVGGVLVAKGLFEDGIITEIIGGVMTVIGGILSVLDKTKE